MSGRDADWTAREVIEARGFGDAFGHSLGHGLGLEVHEAPRLARTNTEPLPAGAIVTIEPGIYLPDQGGVRIEDDVHLAAAGLELLGISKLYASSVPLGSGTVDIAHGRIPVPPR